MVIVEQVLEAPRAGDRQLPGLGEASHVGACLGGPVAAAENGDGRARAGEERHEPRHLLGSGRRRDALVPRGPLRFGALGQHVLGQGQHHGAGPP